MLPTMNRQAFSKNIPQFLLSKGSLAKVSLHGDLSDLWRSEFIRLYCSPIAELDVEIINNKIK